MSLRIDLGGHQASASRRRARAFRELAELTEGLPLSRLDVVAAGETAFAARLVVSPGIAVTRQGRTPAPTVEFRPFGEANPSELCGATVLVEPCNLGRIADGEEGPAWSDSICGRRLSSLTNAGQVFWRTAVDWQADVLCDRFGVPPARIVSLPATAAVPALDRLAAIRLPRSLPDSYTLCLTPVGPAADFSMLIAAHGAAAPEVPPLIILGVDDESWLPALRQSVARVGSTGQVFVLRDLDPLSDLAAIARAQAVVAVDRHPAHAVRLRQAAALGRPAAIRRHPGHTAWIEGGHRYDDDIDSLRAALREPSPIRLRTLIEHQDERPLVSWLVMRLAD